MDQFIEFLNSDTFYFFGTLTIGILLLWAIVKRFIKIAVFAAVLAIIYFGYLDYTGQKIPLTKNEAIKHSSDKFNKFKSKGIQILNKLIIKENFIEQKNN